MSSDMVSVILNQLATLLVNEAKLLGRFGKEIQQIIDELEHMKAFLMFAEGREDGDPRLDAWISQVREVAYDVQDVVDEFILLFGSHGGRGLCSHARKCFNSMKKLPARHRIAHEVQGIMSRIKNLSKSYRRYQIEYGNPSQVPSSSRASAVENSWHDYRDEALLVEESKLVGIDKPKKHLISQLLDADSSDLKVVAVLGMGGLGKTTLVKKVQEDVNVKRHFYLAAWVTVSQTYEMKELLTGLIQQLCLAVQKPVPWEVATITSTDGLKLFVKGFLQDKRYLIVFDDVWNLHFWNAIKFTLPEGSCGNRVILTTRIEDVAKSPSIECHSYVYNMIPLSFEFSYILFCKKTFNDNCCPPHLEDIVGRILRKCDGMPLAIIVIGGVLALKDKSMINEWEMIEQSLGGELDVMSDKLGIITKILSLSYNNLPYHLKSCLLYASIFPEDCEIDGSRLIRFWISEGFVREGPRMTKWEVGKAYLRELVNRSLIQEINHDPLHKICHIHDLLRDIILSKSFRQNFASVVNGEQRFWPKKVRRLAIHEHIFDTTEQISFKYLLSLVIFKSDVHVSKVLSNIFYGGGELLRVLDLEDMPLEEIPKEVFRFFHLKTLSLANTRVRVIPRAIGNLKNLEFLILPSTKVKKLPKEMLQVKGLVQLAIYDLAPGINVPVVGFKCTFSLLNFLSLEILVYIEANDIVLKEMGKLIQMRSLGITCLRNKDGKQLCSSIAQMSKINKLFLQALDDDEVLDLEDMNISFKACLQNLQRLSLDGRMERIPEVVPFLHELVVVELYRTRLMNDPLESLQSLPNLNKLIMDQVFEGESLCFRTGCFLKLQRLSLFRFNNLRVLTVEKGAMPDLKGIVLFSLLALEEFPWWLQHLTKLEEIFFRHVSDKVMSQLLDQNEECEDYKKISHISKFYIWSENTDEWLVFPHDFRQGKIKPGRSQA